MLARISLVVFWWIGIWGLVELLIQKFTRGSFVKGLFAHAFILVAVLLILYYEPDLVEYF
jgi:hypothetical protein